MRHREYELVWATHPKTPNFTQNARGRVIHLATNATQGTLTLCNMLVSFPYEGHADWSGRDLCVVCDAKVKMFKRKATEPPKQKKVTTKKHQYSFTINTDASFIRKGRKKGEGGVAGYAFWIKSAHYKLTGAAAIDEPVLNSSVAELIGIENALWTLDHFIDEVQYLREQRATRGIKIYLNTDSVFAIRAIEGRPSPYTAHKDIIKRVSNIPNYYDIECRHIRSHQKEGDPEFGTPRQWVNDWCDAEAKKVTLARFKEINNAKV